MESNETAGISAASKSLSTANTPMPIKSTKGIDLIMVKATAIFAPSFTPITFIQVSKPKESVMTKARPQPSVAPGHKYPKANANPTEREATEVTRANQVIHPTSNPTNSPNASRDPKSAV